MTETMTFIVAGMTCGHCKRAVSSEVGSVAGVAGVEVDLDAKAVTVTGEGLDAQAIRGAIEAAGYQAS